MKRILAFVLLLSVSNVFAETLKFKCTDVNTKKSIALKIQHSDFFGSYIQVDDGYKWDDNTEPATFDLPALPKGKYELVSAPFDKSRLYLEDSVLEGSNGYFAEATRIQGKWLYDVYFCKR